VQRYGRPNTRDAESIDSIYQDGMLFQMTVSTSKRVKLAGLQASMAGVTAVGGRRQLLIAVPDHSWWAFTQVSIVDAAGAAVAIPAHLDVLVLSIPVRARAGQKRGRVELEKDVEQVLRKQHLPDPVIGELLPGRTDEELEVLETRGVAQMRKKGKWTDVAQLPAANPTHDIFKRTTKGTYGFVALPHK
jgi:hypothetical protein